MPDLATAHARHAAHLAHREWRKVVMQHEALLGFTFKFFHALHVIRRAQRSGDQRLGLAAGKDGRAVSARQYASFNGNSADFIERAAIRTVTLVRDLIAEDALPQ